MTKIIKLFRFIKTIFGYWGMPDFFGDPITLSTAIEVAKIELW